MQRRLPPLKTLTAGAGLTAILALPLAPPAPAAAKTYVPCSKNSGTSITLRAKPRKCDFTYLHNPLALAGRAVGLDWKGWGQRVARARGTGVALHRGAGGRFDRFPARVRLSRRVRCGGYRLYTRVTFIDSDDRRTWSVPPRAC